MTDDLNARASQGALGAAHASEQEVVGGVQPPEPPPMGGEQASEGRTVGAVRRALANVQGPPDSVMRPSYAMLAGPLDDLTVQREASTVMEQEARAEQTHLRPTHETKVPEQRIEW